MFCRPNSVHARARVTERWFTLHFSVLAEFGIRQWTAEVSGPSQLLWLACWVDCPDRSSSPKSEVWQDIWDIYREELGVVPLHLILAFRAVFDRVVQMSLEMPGVLALKRVFCGRIIVLVVRLPLVSRPPLVTVGCVFGAPRGQKTAARAGEGEVHEQHDGPRAHNRPLPGTRPEPFAEVSEPQGPAATVGYVPARPPLIWWGPKLLADSSAEAIDGRTLRYLLKENLPGRRRKRRRRRGGRKRRRRRRRAPQLPRRPRGRGKRGEKRKLLEVCGYDAVGKGSALALRCPVLV